jgi:DNA-binding transcriptional MerR regulator
MDKSPDAFRTISEVADDLDVPQHVLRFWETRFPQIKPLKRGGGRRYYRRDDIDLLRGIRHLLYGEGYTIKGVQRILKEEGHRFVQSIGRGDQSAPAQALNGADEEEAKDGAAKEETARPPRDKDGKMAGEGLATKDIERLEEALHELLECERVLTTLKTPDEAAQPGDEIG